MTCWADAWPRNYNTFLRFLWGCCVEIPAPATRKALWTSKSGPRPWLPNRRRAQAWCKFWRLQLPKVLRGSQFLTILTSKSRSRAGVVQILATSTSKSAPAPSVFNDFDLPKVLRGSQRLTILTSKSLSRPGVVQILPHLQQPILRTRPFLGAVPSQRSHKTIEKHSISRTSYPPNPHVSHLCCITSARSHLLVERSSAATLSIVGS